MNTIKTILLAIGILSLSSVSIASTVSTSGYAESEGSIFVTADGDVATLGGLFDGTGSAFYDMTIEGNNTLSLVGGSFSISPFATYDVTLSVFTAYDATLDTFSGLVASGVNSVSALLVSGTEYFLILEGVTDSSWNISVSAVPVPAAGILFASALLGAGAFGRRKKKSAKASMVGAFARTS